MLVWPLVPALRSAQMVRQIVQVSFKDFEHRKAEVAAELWRAATDVGFFYLCDTGITEV